MKFSIGKLILSDRPALIIASAVIITAAFMLTTFISFKSYERKNKTLREQLGEMQVLQKDLFRIKGFVDSKEKKIGLTNVTGIVPALQQLLDSMGLKAKIIKPLGKKKIKEFTEEDAEMEIDGTDLNALVNLLYKMDNSPVPLKIKNAAIKTTFENQNIFVINITASLLSR